MEAIMRTLIVLTITLILWGCGTKYQDMGFSGGVAAEQMTNDTFRIKARGNGFTKPTTIQDYMVLKAAETTKSVGGTHFLVISASDASRTGYVTTQGSAQTSVVGNTAYTTYQPAQVHQIFKPGQDAYIRVLTIPAGQSGPPAALSADEIIQFVGARVTRG